MIKGLLSLINVVEGEEKPVLLLLGQGFFMGVFLATYKIVATTLFLNHLSDYIREAFFISGVLGIISTFLYASLQNRIHYSRLVIFNMVLVFAFIAITRVMFFYYDINWVIFALFVMLGPITSVLLLSFWGVFGRLFDLRQSKRIIGGIDTGQLIAIIITTFSIPFFIPFIADITNLLLVGEAGIIISLVFMIVIHSKFEISSFHHQIGPRPEETKFKNMFKSNYVIVLSAFLLFSMMVFTFIDYSFMNVTEQQYPDEKQMASFLGVFEGSIMILSLLIQTFVNDKLISMYGLKTSLLVLPVLLILFTGLALFSGHYFGFDITNSNFIWFFLFIVLSKLFVTTLREATENPVFKLFFMPLDSKIRFDVQVKIEGLVNEFARALGGGLILLLGLIPSFELIHYSWILVLIIGVWIYLIFKMYHLYRVNIRLKLERQKNEASKMELKGKDLLIMKLFDSINTDAPGVMTFALRLLAKISPEVFKSTISDFRKEKDNNIKKLVLINLESDFSFIHIANLSEDLEEMRSLHSLTEEGHSNELLFGDNIRDMIHSIYPEERKLAAELIGVDHFEDSTIMLIELLNDVDGRVVKAAMNTAALLKKTELLPFIYDNLQKKNFMEAAADALISFGDEAFINLETIFYNTEDVNVKLRILYIYSKIANARAKELLWGKTNYPDKKVQSNAFLFLSHCDFKAKDDQIQRIKFAIESDISDIVKNLGAIEKFVEIPDACLKDLISALKEEIRHIHAHIYMLLSMIYDQNSIQLVRENIQTQTNEGISYAIELLDVFLSEDLKQKIIPVFDDTSDLERIRRLQMFYPQVDTDITKLMKSIINKDFNQINRWTKACAIRCLGERKVAETYNIDLIANMFNPDDLISEVSAWSLRNIDLALYNDNIGRLDFSKRTYIDNLMIGQELDHSSKLRPHMKFEIASFMKRASIFSDLPSSIIVIIADMIEEIFLEDDTVIDTEEWDNDSYYIVFSGGIEVRDKNNEVLLDFKSGDFPGEDINLNFFSSEVNFHTISDTELLKINKSQFIDLITSEYDATITILNSFQKEEASSNFV